MDTAFRYKDDEEYANDEDFLKWITDLEKVIREWDAKHNNSPYKLPLSESTGLACWHTYYNDEMTPDDAFSDDQTYWDED